MKIQQEAQCLKVGHGNDEVLIRNEIQLLVVIMLIIMCEGELLTV